MLGSAMGEREEGMNFSLGEGRGTFGFPPHLYKTLAVVR